MFWLYVYFVGVIVAYLSIVLDETLFWGFMWEHFKVSLKDIGFLLLSWGLVLVVVYMWYIDSYGRRRDV